jgi:peroxiredoxin Q/BCP
LLEPGQPIPDFDVETDRGARVSASSLRGRRFVLYFYPKDDTPGCTKEACAFRDLNTEFQRLGVPVFGVSADDGKKHARFRDRHALNFPLLIDAERLLLDGFGTWVEKRMYGRKYFGVARATFVIDAGGMVEQVWPKVSPERHPAEVLAYLRGTWVSNVRSL